MWNGEAWIIGFGSQFIFSSQRELHSVPNIDFLLNYDLFCPNWNNQGQNYQNASQVF